MIKAEGRNPVYEVLKAHRVLKLKVAREVEKEKKVQLIIDLSKAYGVPVSFTNMAELGRICRNIVELWIQTFRLF